MADQVSVEVAPTIRSTIDLDALLRDYLLGLVLIAGVGPDVGGRQVQWVHSSDLVDPSPFLTPRTVLLTTGSQFGHTLENETADAYVLRLIGAGTTALGVAVGLQWDRIPPELIAACDRHALPLFRVPYDTPFIAVVRTAVRLLEAQTHATQQREIEKANTGSLFSGRQRLAATERAVREAVLHLLLAGHRPLAERIASPLLPQLPQQNIVAFSFNSQIDTGAMPQLATILHTTDGVFSAPHNERMTIISEPREATNLRRTLTQLGITAGVSERASVNDISELIEQARRAEDVALRQDLNEPLDYRPAMHAGVLQVLQASPEALRRAQGLLAPLRRHDERHADELEHSLTVWLSHHGHISKAAAKLGVHRHTLRSRVRTAESLLQRDLDSPDTRAELWSALKLSPSA